jgi:oligopeptide transport system ATP-binding protein
VDNNVDGPAERLLEVDDLHVEFRTRDGVAKVLNGVSYHVDAGETLAVLGESGSGKSVTAQAVMGILDTPPAHVTGGSVRYHGEELLTAGAERRREVRGEGIAMIFQDALSALNPVLSIGDQIADLIRAHTGASRRAARARAVELLETVGIPGASRRVGDYPHQFSGGMRQRILIGMAIALEPELLLADEPTTALDVTVQAQILELLDRLRHELDMAVLLITHDLGVVSEVADRVAVMYAGRIVERGSGDDLLSRPAHPYTDGLLRSVPQAEALGRDLTTIPGSPPDPARVPTGCAFHPRCSWCVATCRTTRPDLAEVRPGRYAACHRAEEVVNA